MQLTLIKDLGIIKKSPNAKRKHHYGLYQCKCGNNEVIAVSKANKVKKICSDCSSKKIHGLGKTRLNKIWCKMRERCRVKGHKDSKYYSERNIKVCKEWNDFLPFHDWAIENGYKKDLTLDRIDNKKGYSPSNCRFVSTTIQARNRDLQKLNKYGYRGVSKRGNRYYGRITVMKKTILIGYFDTPKEVGIAYNNYIIDNNLEGFILNKI